MWRPMGSVTAGNPGTAPTFANTLGGGEYNFQRSHPPAPFTSPHRFVFAHSKHPAAGALRDCTSLSKNNAPTAFGRNQRRYFKTARGRLSLIFDQVVSARAAAHVFNNIPPPPATHS